MGLQELEDVEVSLKAEKEASLDEKHSKGSGESVIQSDGNGIDGAGTEAMKSVMLQKLESKKNDLVSFHFYFSFAWSSLILMQCKLFDSVEFNGREGSGVREELGCYPGKSTQAAFSRYLSSSTLHVLTRETSV